MLFNLENDKVGVVGKWPIRAEQLEIDKKMGRSLTVDEQLVVIPREVFMNAAKAALTLENVATAQIPQEETKQPFPTID